MTELDFIIEKLEEVRRDLGVSNYTGFLEKARTDIAALAADKNCYADIYYHSTAIPSVRAAVERIRKEESGAGFIFHIINDRKEPVRRFLELMPSVAVIFLDEDFSNNILPFSFFESRYSQYKVLLIIDYSASENNAKEFARRIDRSIKVHTIPHQQFADSTLGELISSLVDSNTLARLNLLARFNTAKPIIPLLQDIFRTENKIMQTRKLLNAQESQIIRKEEQQQNLSDFGNQLKQLVQKNMQEMEKSYRSKYEDLNKPNTGRFSQVTAECTQLVTDFQRQVIAEKSEKVAIHIDRNVINQVLSTVGKDLKLEFKKDETFIYSVFDDLIDRLNASLKEKNIAVLKKQDLYTIFPDPKKILSSYCTINKPYAGELVKKGVNEYFIALRDYTGLIMVVAGLLAPLNMVATISENAVLKSMSNGIRIVTGAITLVMIIYGIYDLRKRIPRKRVEEFQKELGRAKENVSQEAKRIFSESSRDWQSGVSTWIRDVGQNIIAQIETNIKHLGQQRLQEFNVERIQQQRSQQSIDQLYRNLGYAEKSKDAMITKFRDAVSNIEKDIKL